jgi:hypothetical protein
MFSKNSNIDNLVNPCLRASWTDELYRLTKGGGGEGGGDTQTEIVNFVYVQNWSGLVLDCSVSGLPVNELPADECFS